MKKCQFCGAELPDEASFCLSCSSSLNLYEELPEKKKGCLIKFNRKYLPVAFGLVFLLFITVCTVSSDFFRNSLPPKAPETILVPVTKENGEAVTDSEGETVYEAVTVEPTTKKQSLISEIISNIKGKDKDKENNNSGTTDFSESNTSQNPPSTEKNTGNSSEEPSTDKNNATEPTQSQAPTETEGSSKNEPETEIPKVNVNDFEYTAYTSNKSYLSITKYNGNDEHVVIPASYNGQYIVEIRRHTFKDNDKVKIISFEDNKNRPYLWINSDCFYNCSNLHTINMPDEDLGIINNFARYCYAMKTIVLKNGQYRFENGGLYYNNGRQWKMRYFCPAAAPDTLSLPLWCAGIESACNFSELSKLRVINCHEYVTLFPDQTNLPNNLETINIDEKNTNGYDINGIAFHLNSDGKYYCIYPPKNTAKDFTLPNNSFLFTAYIKNPYLEVLRIEETAELQSPVYISCKWAFTNLTTIYIKSGHKNEADLKKEFYGKIYNY